MTTGSDTVGRVAEALRTGLRQIGQRGSLLNEATTLSLLIRPVLDALGYPPAHRIPEYGLQSNRLDEACYARPIANNQPGHAAIIVEAKQCYTDFDRSSPGQGSYTSPDRQIKRYLKQHRASGPDTIGLLTDGIKWRIYRRAGDPSNHDVEVVVEFNFEGLIETGQTVIPGLADDIRDRLRDMVALLSVVSAPTVLSPRRQVNLADQFFSSIIDATDPEDMLKAITSEPDLVLQPGLGEATELRGVFLDAHDNDWSRHAFSPAVFIKSEKPELLPSFANLAAVRLHGLELRRPDVALCARAFAAASDAKASVVLAHTAALDGTAPQRFTQELRRGWPSPPTVK